MRADRVRARSRSMTAQPSPSAGVWQDQQVRVANERAGWKLCGHCNGTGNELYVMYRACPECGGSGQTGEPPLKVRLSRSWRAKRYEFRDTNWKMQAHWWLSYYLGIGQCFHDKKDVCRRCEARPSDVDFEMRRVGPRCAECLESSMCRESVEEAARARAQLKGGSSGE